MLKFLLFTIYMFAEGSKLRSLCANMLENVAEIQQAVHIIEDITVHTDIQLQVVKASEIVEKTMTDLEKKCWISP